MLLATAAHVRRTEQPRRNRTRSLHPLPANFGPRRLGCPISMTASYSDIERSYYRSVRPPSEFCREMIVVLPFALANVRFDANEPLQVTDRVGFVICIGIQLGHGVTVEGTDASGNATTVLYKWLNCGAVNWRRPRRRWVTVRHRRPTHDTRHLREAKIIPAEKVPRSAPLCG